MFAGNARSQPLLLDYITCASYSLILDLPEKLGTAKHSSLFCRCISNDEKKFYKIGRPYHEGTKIVIKCSRNMSFSYTFLKNNLECLSVKFFFCRHLYFLVC
jgi:hypothetical protein